MRRAEFAYAALVAGLCACHHALPVNEVPAADPHILYTGRFDKRARDEVRFAWPGSRVELRFAGQTLRMRLSDVPLEDELRETDWFEIRVDGGPARALHAREGTFVYELGLALGPGQHRASIVKRTEPEVGTATLHGFQLDPQQHLADPPKRKHRHLELVGDSITAGYGNLGATADCHWSADREDIELAYGAVAARELDASYTALAWSGKGVLRNFRPDDRDAMPQLYARVIPGEADSPQADAQPAADAVVVNLGTNDFFQGVPERDPFVASYRALLARLRTRYPKALLVLVIGPMLADDFPQPNSRSLARTWITSVRDELHAAGDAAVETLELWYDPAEGLGCDFHPNVKTHERLGHELAQLIRERLSW